MVSSTLLENEVGDGVEKNSNEQIRNFQKAMFSKMETDTVNMKQGLCTGDPYYVLYTALLIS
jgi:hypothetical protein